MIRYQLICDNGHGFDGWFAGSDAFDRQEQANQLACPVCGSRHVDKALMTPAVPTKGRATVKAEGEAESKAENKTTDGDKAQVAFHTDPKEGELRQALRKLREHVRTHADYVGDKFAEEARKIHYKEAESRGIYGEASADEARSLHEEGIEFHPLPPLPEDHN